MGLSYDDFLRTYVGEMGIYQICLYMSLGLGAMGAGSFNVCTVFLAAVPDHWCASPSLDHLDLDEEEERNLTVPRDEDGGWSECAKYNRTYHNWTSDDVEDHLLVSRDNLSVIPCDQGWRYSTDIYKSTIVTEWDLVCDSRWLQATAAAVFMFGFLVGNLTSGPLSDRFGRKPVLLTSAACMTLSGFLSIFSVSYTMFIIVRFFTGAFAISVYVVAFVMCMEMIGPSWRSSTGIMWQTFFLVGYEFVTVAYFVREWRYLQAVLMASCLPCLLYFCFVPESPRWLYIHNRRDEAEKTIKRIARWNGRSPPDNFDDMDIPKEEETGYVWDLVRTPRMRIRIIVACFIWFVSSVVYYGLSLNSSDLSGDPYLNFCLTGLVEIPAYIITVLVIDRIGRRWSLSIATLLAGVALLLTIIVPAGHTMITLVLVLIGKGGISATFAIIYVITAEVFPTAVRNQAICTGSVCVCIGGTLAPYIAQLSDFGQFIPVIIFGGLAVAAGLLSFLLPESKGVTLPETLQDGENFAVTVTREEKGTPDEMKNLSDKPVNVTVV